MSNKKNIKKVKYEISFTSGLVVKVALSHLELVDAIRKYKVNGYKIVND